MRRKAVARRRRYRLRKQRDEQKAQLLAELERTLAGTFAAFVMAPAVLLGFLIALRLSDAWFGPTRFETESLWIGGLSGAVAGWVVGVRLYQCSPRVASFLLWIASILFHRSLGPEFQEVLELRNSLLADRRAGQHADQRDERRGRS